MRGVRIKDSQVLLKNTALYQRLTLYQYPINESWGVLGIKLDLKQ